MMMTRLTKNEKDLKGLKAIGVPLAANVNH